MSSKENDRGNKGKMHSLHMELVHVLANNMTHLFQHLDLTVNSASKSLLRKQFSTDYSSEVKKQLESGKHATRRRGIDFCLTAISHYMY